MSKIAGFHVQQCSTLDQHMPRENHKERLLRGALICLRSKGYAATTSRDIAAAAGANLGSIGYHYGSKEALLNEALRHGFRAWAEHLTDAVRRVKATEPLERLRLSWEAMSAELDDQEGLLQAFLEALAPASRSLELRGELALLYRELRAEVAAVVSESLGDDPDPDVARIIASLLIAVTDGLQLQWFLEPDQTPSADEINTAVGQAAVALLASGGAGTGQPT
jgi:AcrR family transcriptional regulator